MNWFVINENEHLGPFKEDALNELFRVGELQKDSLIWREGLDEPGTYHDLIVEGLPPELPPEVVGNTSVARDAMQMPVEEQLEEEQLNSNSDVSESADNEAGLIAKIKRQTLAATKKAFKAALVLAVFAAAAFGGWKYYEAQSVSFARPATMGVEDFNRLKEVAFSDSKEPVFAFALSKDKSALWMATNVASSGPLSLKITSQPGKVLANERVVALSKANLEGRLAGFHSFDFEDGQRVIEGWYEVEATTLADLKAPLFSMFGKTPRKRFRYLDQILLTTMKQHHFEKALAKMKEKSEQNADAFWSELGQKYQTIKAMANNIHNSLNKVFDGELGNWGQRVDAFELEYTNSFGGFFTSFVVQNEKSYEDLEKKTFEEKTEIISNYARLSRLAKRLGAETMGVLELMRALENPESKESQETLKQSVDERFGKFVSDIEENLAEVNGKNKN